MAHGPQRLFHSELVLKFSEANYECAAVQRHCLYIYLYSHIQLTAPAIIYPFVETVTYVATYVTVCMLCEDQWEAKNG